MESRCPMCGLPIEVKSKTDAAGNRVWECMSRTPDCDERWQCPLNEELKEEELLTAKKEN